MNFKSNSTSNKRNSRKEEYQNRFYNTLMNQYYRNHKISSNVKNSVILTKKVQNDNEKGDSVLMSMWNTIYKKNISPMNQTFNNNYMGDNMGYSYSNKTIDLRAKASFQNPDNYRSKVIKIKNQKISHIKRRILESENNNIDMGYNNKTYNDSYNLNYQKDNNDSYKNKYKNRNFINDNENLNNDEPFILNDQYISNSFVINLEEKFKNTNNIKGNESNSRLLDKDPPSSLNNTQKYLNQKSVNDESNYKSNSNSNKKYMQVENPKEVNAFRLRDKNIAFEDEQNNTMKNAKNTINYNKIKNIKYDNSSYNHINTNNIKLNTFKIMNARKQNNKQNRNNISSNLTFENSLNNIEFKNTRTKPVKPVLPIRYFFVNKNEILDRINNDSNKNSKNNIKNKSKIFNKIPKSIDNFNKSENSFFKKSSQPEIESCVISFRNSKKGKKIENMKSRLNYSQNNENDSNFIQKRIDFIKNGNIVRRRSIINDNNNDLNKTTYKLYKKPSLALNQNIHNENNRNNDKKGLGEYYAQSYFSTYNKFEKKNNNNSNNDNDLFNKRQYLGNTNKEFKKNNNKSFSIQNRNVFIKKTISSSVSLNNNRTGNNSPIYAKKIPQSYSKIQALSNNNNNIFEYNSSSNIPQINKNRNKKNIVYTRVSNTNLNPTYKLFNSQIINIKNNIFNNNNYYNNELINNENEPLENENQIEVNNIIRKANKSDIIKATIVNDFNHYKKYYKFYSEFSKEEPQIFESISPEEIIKKNIMSLCYYSKSYIKLYKIPKVSESYFSKLYIINSNNKEIKKRDKNLTDNINSYRNKNKKLINQNQNINIKTRNKNNKVENNIKSYNEEVNNIDNKKEYDTRTYRNEITNLDNNIVKIEVNRKRNKSKSVKELNNDIYNIKKINPKEKKVEQNENNINKFETMINNINNINNSNNSNNEIINKKNEPKINDKKDLKISSKRKYRNNYLRKQRSSSHKMKDKKFNKNNDKIKDKKNNNNINTELNNINNNIVKIKVNLPNSEARRKKYKINIVKRVKVKYKKSVNDFSEEKILINSINNEINEENSLRRKRNKTIMHKNNKKEEDKDNKILSIIKEDLENYISFSLKNQKNNIFSISNNYNFSIIEQLLIKEKIDLSDLIEYYLKIGLETLDSKDRIIIANDYIQNIIENYKRTYINKNNFVKIHEDILELLIVIVINLNKKRIKNITNIENKYLYDIIGALFYSLLINELFFVSDLNKFINCEEQVLINIAKIVRFIIIYANDENMKNNYFETFKNCKLFFNNPIYFKYVTKYLKLINSKNND